MKHEWKKHEKSLYGAKISPSLIDVPIQNFIMINGIGNPNNTDFSNRVSALYSLAYAIKMDYKTTATKNSMLNEIDDFTVYPLEGIWRQTNTQRLFAADKLIKENLEYTIMIRQPNFITMDKIQSVLERIKIKKPNALYHEIFFDTIEDGKCIEILHIGPYDNEAASFEKMDHFAKENRLHRIENFHREIYLNNAKKSQPDKLKTILRYRVS